MNQLKTLTQLKPDLNLKHAWAAGFFDGEGSLSIYLLIDSTGKRTVEKGGFNQVRVIVQVSQQSPYCLNTLQDMFGGHIAKYSNRSGGTKKYYKWALVGRANMIAFLTAIQPFSVVKRKQIDVALRCVNMQLRRGYIRYTVQQKNTFRSLQTEIRYLNTVS